jgi:transcriptional regulator with XRE-family HTH domain
MTDSIARVEEARLSARLSQTRISQVLGITQGHYSKVVTDKVPLTEGLRSRMEDWLETQEGSAAGSDVAQRMQELAASIRHQCIELMHLAGLVIGSPGEG